MRFTYLLIGILAFIGSSSAHPLHLSLINIDFAGDSAHISIRVFDTGWLPHLAECHPEANFSNQADSAEIDQQFVIEYFKKSLVLGIENTNTTLNFVVKKMEEGSIWYLFNAKIPATIEKCTVENRILTECYGDQKNLVVIKKGSFESGLEFDSSHTIAEVKLK